MFLPTFTRQTEWLRGLWLPTLENILGFRKPATHFVLSDRIGEGIPNATGITAKDILSDGLQRENSIEFLVFSLSGETLTDQNEQRIQTQFGSNLWLALLIGKFS